MGMAATKRRHLSNSRSSNWLNMYRQINWWLSRIVPSERALQKMGFISVSAHNTCVCEREYKVASNTHKSRKREREQRKIKSVMFRWKENEKNFLPHSMCVCLLLALLCCFSLYDEACLEKHFTFLSNGQKGPLYLSVLDITF